jgi:hypothetical protein
VTVRVKDGIRAQPSDRDILANLGSFLLEKKEDADLTDPNPRRSRH